MAIQILNWVAIQIKYIQIKQVSGFRYLRSIWLRSTKKGNLDLSLQIGENLDFFHWIDWEFRFPVWINTLTTDYTYTCSSQMMALLSYLILSTHNTQPPMLWWEDAAAASTEHVHNSLCNFECVMLCIWKKNGTQVKSVSVSLLFHYLFFWFVLLLFFYLHRTWFISFCLWV